MLARVLGDGETSEAFPVTNGVKQGCAMALTPFSMMFSAMLSDAFKACELGIEIQDRRKAGQHQEAVGCHKGEGRLLSENFSSQTTALLNASHKQELQAEVESFASSCGNFGLAISTMKNQNHEKQISFNGQTLKLVETFTYLSSTLPRNANINAKTSNRICKGSSAFGRLRKKCLRKERHQPRKQAERPPGSRPHYLILRL